jgi:hypothetical protein
MSKSCTFRKMKNDHEAGSSSRPKPKRSHAYVHVDVAWALYETRTSAGWDFIHLPIGWLLSSRRMQVPMVPTEGRAGASRFPVVGRSCHPIYSPTTRTTLTHTLGTVSGEHSRRGSDTWDSSSSMWSGPNNSKRRDNNRSGQPRPNGGVASGGRANRAGALLR